MKKALIVAHMPNFIPSFEQNDIRILQCLGYEVTAAFNTEGYDRYKSKMIVSNVKIVHIAFERSPYSLKNIKAYRQIKKLIELENFDLIHCHTPVGGVITRLAARKVRNKGTKVLYTAHGFHFYKGAPFINWFVYYTIEKLCSYLTDVLIVINQEDYKIAQTNMKAAQIVYIPGIGVDIEKMRDVSANREAIRGELGLLPDDIMVLSVGELIRGKNHKIIMDAINKLHDDKIHYYIAGCGCLQKKYETTIRNQHRKNIHLLGYRTDVIKLYQAADIFAFPSLREGLPIALVEAMVMELPIVASDIRGVNECVVNGTNGILCNPKDCCQYAAALQQLANDDQLKKKYGTQSRVRAEQFSLAKVQIEMRKIYAAVTASDKGGKNYGYSSR